MTIKDCFRQALLELGYSKEVAQRALDFADMTTTNPKEVAIVNKEVPENKVRPMIEKMKVMSRHILQSAKIAKETDEELRHNASLN